jgi:hypothetical protein
MAPGTHPAITDIQVTEVEVSVQPETWRARSATRRFRVKPPGIIPLSAPYAGRREHAWGIKAEGLEGPGQHLVRS